MEDASTCSGEGRWVGLTATAIIAPTERTTRQRAMLSSIRGFTIWVIGKNLSPSGVPRIHSNLHPEGAGHNERVLS
jgi:hypothetical protein